MAKIIIDEESKKYIKKSMYKDQSISLEHRGLIATICVLTKNEELDISNLSKLSGINEWAIRQGLISLESSGFLKRKKVNRDGKINWDFNLILTKSAKGDSDA